MVNIITAIGKQKVLQWTMHSATNETHSFYSDYPEKLGEFTEIMQSVMARHLRELEGATPMARMIVD